MEFQKWGQFRVLTSTVLMGKSRDLISNPDEVFGKIKECWFVILEKSLCPGNSQELKLLNIQAMHQPFPPLFPRRSASQKPLFCLSRKSKDPED